jgi:hypothetical protein
MTERRYSLLHGLRVRSWKTSAKVDQELFAEAADIIEELVGALVEMKRVFCDPMTRRALGGHNEEQMAATLTTSALLTKLGEAA